MVLPKITTKSIEITRAITTILFQLAYTAKIPVQGLIRRDRAQRAGRIFGADFVNGVGAGSAHGGSAAGSRHRRRGAPVLQRDVGGALEVFVGVAPGIPLGPGTSAARRRAGCGQARVAASPRARARQSAKPARAVRRTAGLSVKLSPKQITGRPRVVA